MSKIGLIIKREYSTRVKKKSFIIMSILGPLLIVGFLAFTIYLNKNNNRSYKILVKDDAHFLNEKKITNNDKYELFGAPEDKTYQELQEILKKDENFDLLLYIPENITYSKTAKCLYRKIPSTAAQKHLTSLINEAIELHKIEQNNINEETYRSIKTKINLDVFDIENPENKNIQRKGYVGYIFAFIIYIFIFMYAVQVMKGVIEEKTNRIVEVIISSVKSFHLMMGKIIGIGLVGFTQFLIWISVITILSISILFSISSQINSFQNDVIEDNLISETNSVALSNSNEKIDEISQFLLYEIDWTNMFLFFAIYFIGGYLIYGSLMAAIGSSVNEETDTQQFMIPLTIPLIFSLTMIPQVIDNPSSNTAFWLSEIPFTSPLIMLVRIAMGIGEGSVELWEIILSIFLLATTFIFCTWISGKIYKTGILLYGKKPSYRDLYKWIKS